MDKSHFWSLGLLVWSLNMSSKAMQARVMLLQSNGPHISIILLIKIDGSSKLCFEEKLNSAIDDKIFEKSLQSISTGEVMVSMAKCSVMQSLQKVSKISSFEPKIQRESENQCVLKSMKK